jgi:hypothetical protein
MPKETRNFGAPQCAHIHLDGERCGLSARHNQQYCHFHDKLYERRPEFGQQGYELPFLEDPASIQIALVQVARALMAQKIEYRTARLLLSVLKVASSNLKSGQLFIDHVPAEEESSCPSLAQILLDSLREQPESASDAQVDSLADV